MIQLPMPQLGYIASPRRPFSLGCITIMVAFVAALHAPQSLAQSTPTKLRTISLGAGMHNIKAELAITPEERQIGLMHRTSMGTNEGMLFVFEHAGQQCFWMKNTLIPLQIAFVADDGTIVNLSEMKPKSLANHCSERPVRYVLEMNTGWFTKRKIEPGTKLRGEPFNAPH